MTRPGSPRLLLNTAGTHWWPPSGGRRRPPHETGAGGEEPDRAVLDPRGGAPPTIVDACPSECKPRCHDTRRFLGIRPDTSRVSGNDTPRIPWTRRIDPKGEAPRPWVERPPEKDRATRRAFSKCRPGCAPGGGRFQGNCSRVGTRHLLEMFCLAWIRSTPHGDGWFLCPLYSTPSAWQQPPTPSDRKKLSSIVDIPHESPFRSGARQVSRPARTASLIRSPSAAPRTSASSAWPSQRPTPLASPRAYAVSDPR